MCIAGNVHATGDMFVIISTQLLWSYTHTKPVCHTERGGSRISRLSKIVIKSLVVCVY